MNLNALKMTPILFMVYLQEPVEQAEDLLPDHILHRVEVVPALPEVVFLVEVQDQDHQVTPREVAVQVLAQDLQVLQGAGDNRSD